jgi:hypothetical protein
MSLPAGSYIVLANTPTPFKLPENKGLLINAEQSFPDFDIPDTETLTIELLIDEEIKDSFSSDVSWMQKWNDGRMSFQKVLLPDKMIITNSREYAVNNKSGYTINPGALLTTQDDDAVDYTIPKPPKPLDPTPFDAC